MEPNTAAILRLAWARTLGLTDEAFDPAVPGAAQHLQKVVPDRITVVELFGQQAVLAPTWFHAAIADPQVRDEIGPLTEPANLLALSGRRMMRVVFDQVITATDRYVEDPSVPISLDPAAVNDVEHVCPPDDISQADLAASSSTFVALDDADLPAAAAGYREQAGFLAELSVLTAPTHRLRGWGTKAASVALNDALDGGLIPQLRRTTGSLAAAALGSRLGLQPIGRFTELQAIERIPPH